MDFGKVTRVEVIDQSGRMLVLYGVEEVWGSLQDDGRTFKLFLKTQEQTG